MRPGPGPVLSAPLKAVLQHFRGQRPLRGGSLLITIFGDAIAPRGGAIALESLIRLAAPFGLTERLVRTSVARLARDSWLAAERCGRRSEYRLSATGAARFADATQRIYAPAPRSWDGRWTLLLLPAGQARPRSQREALRWHGFGQLHAALFAHPGTTPAQAREWLHDIPGAAEALLLHSSGADRVVDRKLAARGWDLQLLDERYRRFAQRFEPLQRWAATPEAAGEAAFLARTLLIHEYRKIHLRDPLLPLNLLPADWVGARAYEMARRIYREVLGPAESYLSETARRLQEPLPKAGAALYGRFGGLPRRA